MESQSKLDERMYSSSILVESQSNWVAFRLSISPLAAAVILKLLSPVLAFESDHKESYKDSLHVYDLSQGLARQLSTTCFGKAIEGIWHTGIVVYGNQYYFGRGIQNAPVGTPPYGTPLKVVDLGFTHVLKNVFEAYLQEIDHRYTAETYRLLTHNYNNFSNEVAQFLVGASIPDYILNLPNEVMGSPMGALMSY
ncbi:uncharacterized protein [Henckelia pumila]|uniref:uncharacterized protein n=1 Tax=Henckelia pumila TaxID=405737 RepID=UPI003C6DC558